MTKGCYRRYTALLQSIPAHGPRPPPSAGHHSQKQYHKADRLSGGRLRPCFAASDCQSAPPAGSCRFPVILSKCSAARLIPDDLSSDGSSGGAQTSVSLYPDDAQSVRSHHSPLFPPWHGRPNRHLAPVSLDTTSQLLLLRRIGGAGIMLDSFPDGRARRGSEGAAS